MRNTLLILFMLKVTIFSAQIKNVRIYSDNQSVCYLNQINDTLIMMTFEQYSGIDGYLLGVFTVEQDSLKIQEIDEEVLMKTDVFYLISDEIADDSLLIEYYVEDYSLKGYYTFSDLSFELNGKQYSPTNKKKKLVESQSVIVPTPKENEFELTVYDGATKVDVIDVDLEEGFNVIFVRASVLFSMPTFITDTFEELVPDKIIVDGNELNLTIELSDY